MSDPTVREMALAVAKDLEDPGRFTTRAWARNALGHPVHYGNLSAMRLCAWGHGMRTFGQAWWDVVWAYRRRFPSGMSADNDGDLGRLGVRDRLLELARSLEVER